MREGTCGGILDSTPCWQSKAFFFLMTALISSLRPWEAAEVLIRSGRGHQTRTPQFDLMQIDSQLRNKNKILITNSKERLEWLKNKTAAVESVMYCCSKIQQLAYIWECNLPENQSRGRQLCWTCLSSEHTTKRFQNPASSFRLLPLWMPGFSAEMAEISNQGWQEVLRESAPHLCNKNHPWAGGIL